MKTKLILLFYFIAVLNAYSFDNESNSNSSNSFGINIGIGTSIANDRNYGLDACFHAGIDYTLDKNMSSVSLRYYKFNWNLETYTNNSYSVHSDVDMDVISLLYRLPLGNLTVAIGPAIFYNEAISYLSTALNLGYLDDIGDSYGYEAGLATFYLDYRGRFYFYLYCGIWIKL